MTTKTKAPDLNEPRGGNKKIRGFQYNSGCLCGLVYPDAPLEPLTPRYTRAEVLEYVLFEWRDQEKSLPRKHTVYRLDVHGNPYDPHIVEDPYGRSVELSWPDGARIRLIPCGGGITEHDVASGYSECRRQFERRYGVQK